MADTCKLLIRALSSCVIKPKRSRRGAHYSQNPFFIQKLDFDQSQRENLLAKSCGLKSKCEHFMVKKLWIQIPMWAFSGKELWCQILMWAYYGKIKFNVRISWQKSRFLLIKWTKTFTFCKIMIFLDKTWSFGIVWGVKLLFRGKN